MIASNPAQCNKSLHHYKSRNKQSLKLSGEPFVFDVKSSHHGEFMVLLLGPGRYWKCRMTGTVGEGIDSSDASEMKAILEHRRNGEIWGRWYSDICPQGEIGFNHFARVREICESEYQEELDRLRTNDGR